MVELGVRLGDRSPSARGVGRVCCWSRHDCNAHREQSESDKEGLEVHVGRMGEASCQGMGVRQFVVYELKGGLTEWLERLL